MDKLTALCKAMITYDKGDPRRIHHFLKVHAFAAQIGREEGLDEKTLNAAVRYIHEADVLIIGGTSLAVYPAAGLIDYFQGDKLVVINKSATPRDSHADLLIQGPIGEVFHSIQNP